MDSLFQKKVINKVLREKHAFEHLPRRSQKQLIRSEAAGFEEIAKRQSNKWEKGSFKQQDAMVRL